MVKKVSLALAMLVGLAGLAKATPSINVGDYTINPGDSLTIQVVVVGTATDTVQGVNLNAQIGDGGVLLGGSTPSPGAPFFDYDHSTAERNAILLTGTIFQTNNTGVNDANDDGAGGDFGNLVLWLATTTNAGTVVANGLLATITISGVGATPGVYPLTLAGTNGDITNINGPTDFSGLPINITNGSITVTPEPASVVMGLFAAAGLGAVAIRRRMRRA